MTASAASQAGATRRVRGMQTYRRPERSFMTKAIWSIRAFS